MGFGPISYLLLGFRYLELMLGILTCQGCIGVSILLSKAWDLGSRACYHGIRSTIKMTTSVAARKCQHAPFSRFKLLGFGPKLSDPVVCAVAHVLFWASRSTQSTT